MKNYFFEFWNEVICPLAKGDIGIKPLLVTGVGIYAMLIGCRFVYRFKFEIRVKDLIYALFWTPYAMFAFFWGLMFVNENVFIVFVPVYPLLLLRIISRSIKILRRRGKAFSVTKPVDNSVGMSYCELMSSNSQETKAENIVASDSKNEVLPEK